MPEEADNQNRVDAYLTRAKNEIASLAKLIADRMIDGGILKYKGLHRAILSFRKPDEDEASINLTVTKAEKIEPTLIPPDISSIAWTMALPATRSVLEASLRRALRNLLRSRVQLHVDRGTM